MSKFQVKLCQSGTAIQSSTNAAQVSSGIEPCSALFKHWFVTIRNPRYRQNIVIHINKKELDNSGVKKVTHSIRLYTDSEYMKKGLDDSTMLHKIEIEEILGFTTEDVNFKTLKNDIISFVENFISEKPNYGKASNNCQTISTRIFKELTGAKDSDLPWDDASEMVGVGLGIAAVGAGIALFSAFMAGKNNSKRSAYK